MQLKNKISAQASSVSEMYPIHETSSKERNPTNEALEIASVHHGLENLAGNTNSKSSLHSCLHMYAWPRE